MFVSLTVNIQKFLLLFPKMLEGFVNITKFRADHVEGVVDPFLSRYTVLLPSFLGRSKSKFILIGSSLIHPLPSPLL